ncbi:glutamate--cysteine ligase [Micromonospora sp. DT81.3]|uniref:glutamate--cysteine ligase n=1 Tax=Micromonospora sp. DT81.3 TaxID=3416523 RepID=UPI003CECB4C3
MDPRTTSAAPLRRSGVAASRRIRSIGVEEELLLVGAETLHPVPVAGDLLDAAAGAWQGSRPLLEFEVKREQIEVVSPPRLSLDQLSATILEGRRAADLAAGRVGARAVALATATLPCEPHLVSTARYQRMGERFGLTMVEQLTCGFHVHVDIESPDEGVAVLDRIRPWLPVLLAMSANSPFWQGKDTGFASYRYQAWGRWPTAGPYDRFGSAEGYRAAIEAILETGVSLDEGMIYFDARLSAHAPTVEVRIADVCLRPDDAATIAVLIRALIETAARRWRAGEEADDISTSVLRLASWRASRFGLSENLVHPITRMQCTAREAVAALLSHIEEGFESPMESTLIRASLSRMLDRGTGASEQREAWTMTGECRDVVAAAIAVTHN